MRSLGKGIQVIAELSRIIPRIQKRCKYLGSHIHSPAEIQH